MNNLLDRITISSQVCDGQPVIRGMRITVKTILDYLAAGEATENILKAYPKLEKEDIQACLQFASRTLERRIYAFELAS
ncbi:MAG: hypothetical protein BGO68_02250 [Candidatus Amoebophilus sp. 36-38]|nr:MAG: hypothetical protein BGO68_02250 [Candidatus Amoebophilus sp. 36-38]